jgi:hypothetical protein
LQITRRVPVLQPILYRRPRPWDMAQELLRRAASFFGQEQA